MEIMLPQQVRKILEELSAAGFEAAVVGGCVRDSLLGRKPQDWDVTTSALPQQSMEALKDFTVLETGLKHGTVTAVPDGMPVEITTYRVDGGYSDSRHPDRVTFTRSLREDLARRDFTINALAYSEEHGVIDCFGGRDDLADGIVRCVGDPALRFGEDALRIMRGLRFASVLGFSVEAETARSMRAQKSLLDRIAKERIGAELTKLLCGKGAQDILFGFYDVLGQVLPELLPMVGFGQNNPYHRYDVWEHTARAVGAVEPEPVLRLTMLLHDSGKPHCYTQDSRGVGHFYGHAKISGQLADTALKRLKFDSRTIRRVLLLIRYHDLPPHNTEKWIRRQLCRIGEENLRALLSVKEADCRAQNPDFLYRLDQLGEVRRTLSRVLAENQCFSLRDLKVDGNDLIALGFPAGKELGETLRLLLNEVIDGKCPNERVALLRLATRRIRR